MSAASAPQETVLADGTRAIVRAFRSTDRATLERAWYELSPRSVIQRFQHAVTHLTPAELRHLVDSVDQVDHLAWGAVEAGSRPERGLGIARAIRSETEPQEAELAVVVIDAVQGRGLGRVLVQALARAAPEAGIRTLVGHVQAENEPALAMVRACGGIVAPGGWGTLEVRIPTGPARG